MVLAKKIKILIASISVCLMLAACTASGSQSGVSNEEKTRIVATSMAVVQIMDKLNVDLAGVPQSAIAKVPERYKEATKIGSPMNPDIEIIASLHPDYVFAPVSLVPDLKPKFDKLNTNYGFVNLNNVEGMYASIRDLGDLLNKKEEAALLISDYEKFMSEFKKRNRSKDQKTVLILMGLPGSYVVATEYSYVGSLVRLAGAKNVYESSSGEAFINVNIEDMMKKNPDIILRTAHAMPDDVMAMFAKEFKENDNWKHFTAVRENKVYDLKHENFGMSANFNYPEALKDLEEILYE